MNKLKDMKELNDMKDNLCLTTSSNKIDICSLNIK